MALALLLSVIAASIGFLSALFFAVGTIGPVDFAWLSDRIREAGGSEELAAWVPQANTALEVLQRAQGAGLPLADVVARHAWTSAARMLGVEAELEIAVFDREGGLVARTSFRKVG